MGSLGLLQLKEIIERTRLGFEHFSHGLFQQVKGYLKGVIITRIVNLSFNERVKKLISACVLIRSERGKFDEVANRIKQIKCVKKAFTVLGRYDVIVDLECSDFKTLGTIVLKLGRMAGAVFAETLVEIQQKED